MKNAIASLALVAVRADGTTFDLTAEIGAPYWSADFDCWRCPASLTPLYGRLADAAGEDSLQALCLATRTVFYLLDGFQQDGGQLLMSGEPFPIGSYFPVGAIRR